MPSETYLISDIASFSRETISKSYKTYVDYLDTGSITNNCMNSLERYYDLSKLPSRAKKAVREKDIIYSTVRPNNRHFGIVPATCDNMVVSTGFSVIRANKQYVLPEYLYYILTSNEIVELLQSIAEQSVSTYPSINDTDIGNISVELPSIDEQQAIIEIIEPINQTIRNKHMINDNLGGAYFVS